jgi:hypothetical protein
MKAKKTLSEQMGYKTIVLLLATIMMSCGSKYFVTTKKIEGGYPSPVNFELSEISVTSTNDKYGFPVKYSKNEIEVCIISFENLDLIQKDYQTVDEYWSVQEKKDSINNYYMDYKDKKPIFFQKEQKFVNWIKYPFDKHTLSKKSSIKFEKGKWYKLSHLDRKYDEMDLGIGTEIFIYVDMNGKLKIFYFIDGKCIKKHGWKPYPDQ